VHRASGRPAPFRSVTRHAYVMRRPAGTGYSIASGFREATVPFASLDRTPMKGRSPVANLLDSDERTVSRRLNRKSMKRTKDMKGAEGTRASGAAGVNGNCK